MCVCVWGGGGGERKVISYIDINIYYYKYCLKLLSKKYKLC